MRMMPVMLVVTACATEPAPVSEPPAIVPDVQTVQARASAAATEENDPRWHQALLAIAGGYVQWGRVEDEMRWAPWLCRLPMPARARLSESGDETTHGRKLYTLYAKDPAAYGARASVTPVADAPELASLAQVIVKEAWKPVLSDIPVQGLMGGDRRENLLPAMQGDKAYVAGEKAGLYVIFKPVKTDIETDAGWVYGTIAPDGSVTSAGKVASCMGCHEQATHGRLFGLARDTRAAAQPAG